jgi:prepilin-type N-terminal cleavage/methylation domain-containing protein/prepilin-type processing-associated H-X9-DG protein
MKRFSFPGSSRGFALLEVLVVIAIVAIFFMLMLPISHVSNRATGIQCMSNLQHDSTALILWMSDHNQKFPWQLTTADGGSMEQITAGRVAPHFQVLSNYVLHPIYFACPTDTKRRRGISSLELQENQISYFINLDAVTNNPAFIVLLGDRHLEAKGMAVAPGLFTWSTNQAMGWTGELHANSRRPIGYLAFADGHVQPGKDLPGIFQKQNLETDRLVVP